MRVLVGNSRSALSLPSPPRHRGGEGAVHLIPASLSRLILGQGWATSGTQSPNLAAKLFFKNNDKRRLKLEALKAGLPPNCNDYAFTGPLELLFSVSEPSQAIGYVMPYFDGLLPLYAVTRGIRNGIVSTSRALEIARRICAAFAAAHRVGIVIGDVNESNLGVTKSGAVVVLDTDSFQVRSREVTFRCAVGRPEYTPPELQGVKFSEVDRTSASDAFGLGVILFGLFLNGEHPFAAIYRRAGNAPSIGKRIKYGLFPHADGGISDFEPKPSTAAFKSLPKAIKELFHDCFEAGHRDRRNRPSANDWHEALSKTRDSDLPSAKASRAPRPQPLVITARPHSHFTSRLFRRERRIVLAASGVLLSAGVGISGVLLQHESSPGTDTATRFSSEGGAPTPQAWTSLKATEPPGGTSYSFTKKASP